MWQEAILEQIPRRGSEEKKTQWGLVLVLLNAWRRMTFALLCLLQKEGSASP